MAYYNSYSAIVSAVVETAEDDSQEFLDYVPKSMELAQMRLQDELDLDLMNTQIETTCVANNRLIVKPVGLRFVNNAFIVTSAGEEKPLKLASTTYLRDYAPVQTVTGEPKYYSEDYSADYFMVAPTPASAYLIRAEVRLDIPYLTPSVPQNYFTQYCANALFFATMKEQAAFMKNPVIEQEFETKYLNAVQGINNRGSRARRQDGGTASTNESGKNTLLGTK